MKTRPLTFVLMAFATVREESTTLQQCKKPSFWHLHAQKLWGPSRSSHPRALLQEHACNAASVASMHRCDLKNSTGLTCAVLPGTCMAALSVAVISSYVVGWPGFMSPCNHALNNWELKYFENQEQTTQKGKDRFK